MKEVAFSISTFTSNQNKDI